MPSPTKQLKHSMSNRHIRDRIPGQAQWALAKTCAADSDPVLSLMTDGAVWACSLCVQWDDGGDKIQVHLMETSVPFYCMSSTPACDLLTL